MTQAEGGRGGGWELPSSCLLAQHFSTRSAPLSPSPSPCSFALFLPFPLLLIPSIHLSMAHLLGFLSVCVRGPLPPSLNSAQPTAPAPRKVGPPPSQEELKLDRYNDFPTTKARPLQGELSLGGGRWEWGVGLSFQTAWGGGSGD